ncbi:WbqC family protein [Rhodoferax sp.]|uniref:WbqC family protein n=1 Tax=Rhodoferax sp. TaxID=50421 RepID=UPI001EB1426D|nr:WbqC family protein [Rhodoferax sp.]MBT9507326.1 WbqC family protein [Rhodoferax sp.]
MTTGRLVVAGHQPNFLPWFGYFEKMLKCDIFVYSDDVQYPKQSYTNRVEIMVGKAPGYLTLPVVKGGDARIADKQFVQDEVTCSKLTKTLQFNFGGFPHFRDIEPLIDEFQRAYWQYQSIADLNIHMNQHLAACMGIETPVRRGTELGLEAFHRNDRLVQRCRILEAGTYLCGQGADGYQDEAFIAGAGIELRRIDYAIGRELFGEDLRFSVLQGIARRGIVLVRDAVAGYRQGDCD